MKFFFNWIMPKTARANSTINPITNTVEGIPSTIKLMVLPKVKLAINTIFIIVEVCQNLKFIIPKNQITEFPKYRIIIALKIFVKSIVSTLKSKISGRT